MKYQEIIGNLIELSLSGSFDVIAHGCNCQNVQKSGISPQFVKAFSTDKFPKESPVYKGNMNKLGCIDFVMGWLYEGEYTAKANAKILVLKDGRVVEREGSKRLTVVNCYTQFMYGTNHTDGVSKPLDYEALTLCLRKINHTFKGKHIGLPLIGCGLAGGIWDYTKLLRTTQQENNIFEKFICGNLKDVKTIIQEELKDMDVTIVFLEQNKHLMLNGK